jgi:hypothetical protein
VRAGVTWLKEVRANGSVAAEDEECEGAPGVNWGRGEEWRRKRREEEGQGIFIPWPLGTR